MKAEEIIKRLESFKDMIHIKHGFYDKYIDEENCKIIDKAIEVVNKVIPQKVKRDPFGAECPNCGGRVVLPSTYTLGGKMIGIRCDYCYSCGQALDWSEE